jgi:two-component system response regulator HupR/HoxA
MEKSARTTVLVVDDEIRSLETLKRILDEEFNVLTASSATEAEGILEEERVQAILCDHRMPGISGVEFLTRVREQWPDIVRMIISGYTEPEDIIDGVNRAGIFQYITKPWHPDNLLLIVRNAVRLNRLQRENELFALELKLSVPTLERHVAHQRATLKNNLHIDRIIRTPTSPINDAIDQLRRVAPHDVSVLLTGESGTGKELFARALHYNSPRADSPFVAESCAALPDQLLESELFGHRKGAFTGACSNHAGLFEQADGGTIFLDEIGEISPAFQVKLLRVLQEGEIRPLGDTKPRRVDVRVVAATNRDLEEEVRVGRFRHDLYYRLAAVTLRLPTLRERPMDIAMLAQAILQDYARAFDVGTKRFADETLACMQEYHWPGNVRELQNEIQRMLVLSQGEQLGPELLSAKVRRAAPADMEQDLELLDRVDGTLKERMDALEARILRETLIRHRWNKSRAAQELGLSRVGLRGKLERYGLEPLNS